MNRRELLQLGGAIGLASLIEPARAEPVASTIPVAFLLNGGAVLIDFAGPWEVFDNVAGKFRLFTVSESRKPIRASGGMKIVPDYDYATAPQPKIVVIPAQESPSPRTLAWIRKAARHADLTFSVCTGAFVLAATGLLSGKSATTHHSAFGEFAMGFPDVKLRRGARFVDEGAVASSGGLSSGIDLALHVVERYFGRGVAQQTADQLEYQGRGWLDADSNAQFGKPPVPAAGKAICQVCWMEVDPASAPHSDYKGVIYSFCMQAHKNLFDAAPDTFTG